MASSKILIVDDEDNICQLLNLYLTKEGFSTTICHSGKEAVRQVREQSFDIVLMDIMMDNNDRDGLDAVAAIRQFSSVPVIFLSGKGQPMDIINGLDIGADGYVTKPFEPQELISRIKALLRRSQPVVPVAVNSDITIGTLHISISNYVVTVADKKLDMPPKEIELLYYLCTNPMRAFTREQLLSQVWGANYKGDTRTVDVHIKRIREKLGKSDKWRLDTVWGVGYKFEIF